MLLLTEIIVSITSLYRLFGLFFPFLRAYRLKNSIKRRKEKKNILIRTTGHDIQSHKNLHKARTQIMHRESSHEELDIVESFRRYVYIGMCGSTLMIT